MTAAASTDRTIALSLVVRSMAEVGSISSSSVASKVVEASALLLMSVSKTLTSLPEPSRSSSVTEGSLVSTSSSGQIPL